MIKGMRTSDVSSILKQVEELLASAGELPAVVEQSVGQLLNVVEALSSDKKALADEVERLRKQLEQKKKAKTTAESNDGSVQSPKSDHSSEERRRKLRKPKTKQASDCRSFKNLTVHETIECPVDPKTLPPDAVRVGDESVVVQDIEIKPRNTRFQRHVYYSAAEKKFFRGPLRYGYDTGDFGPDLRALILSLKYCGNMSEPKIREVLENFDVQVSAGSLSNILTNTATQFEQEYHDLLTAGLSSTPYQQTDDTSARVRGESWHTHILCNPFYTAYSTRASKDRLAVLSVLQNTDDLRFRLGSETLDLLQKEFAIPVKWQQAIAALGKDVEFDARTLKTLLDDWFGERNKQTRTSIEHAAAIVYYRHQTSMPVVPTLVCDDAKQFKLLTDKLALCWIHAGRHYEKLSPVVPRHAKSLESFAQRYWDYYVLLQDYRASPTEELAARLRLEFDELFSTRTGYDALDDRIAKTAAKKGELLTVLTIPEVPLHNNASELGARVSARRRDVSLHSRSVRGVRAMDIFTTLVQTSKKLGIRAFDYLRDRLSRRFEMPSLAQCIHQAAQPANPSG
jgi:uncharacterized small protein (DUF1192 family)